MESNSIAQIIALSKLQHKKNEVLREKGEKEKLLWYGKVRAVVTKKKKYDITVDKGKDTERDVEKHTFKLDDGTGEIWMDWWEPGKVIKEGDEIEAHGVYVKHDDYRDSFQLCLSKKNSGIKKLGRAASIPDSSPSTRGAEEFFDLPKKEKSPVATTADFDTEVIKKDMKNLIDNFAEEVLGKMDRLDKELRELVDKNHVAIMDQLKILIDGPGEK
jgi:hypothetical protein